MMVNLIRFTRLNHQTDPGTFGATHQMLMHGPRGQQRTHRDSTVAYGAIGKHHEIDSGICRLFGFGADTINGRP